jgi:hypothetical protein
MQRILTGTQGKIVTYLRFGLVKTLSGDLSRHVAKSKMTVAAIQIRQHHMHRRLLKQQLSAAFVLATLQIKITFLQNS